MLVGRGARARVPARAPVPARAWVPARKRLRLRVAARAWVGVGMGVGVGDPVSVGAAIGGTGRTGLRSGDVTDGVDRARALLDDAARTLRAAAVADEALGEYVEPKAVLGIRRDPTIRSLGRVWRVGALLIGSTVETGGRVWATGRITRVTEAGRSQFVSVSAEVRRAYRAAAAKGHFEPGDTVNHGAVPIPLDQSLVGSAGVLFVEGDVPLVRWSPTAGAAVPLEEYLADRVGLLVDPPRGATD